MKYDLCELRSRVAKRRKKFAIYTALLTTAFISAIALAALSINTTVTFIAVFATLLLVGIEFRIISAFSVSVLFSKEFTGVNIKEHEYTAARRGPLRMSGRAIVPNTGANKKKPVQRLLGTVFLRLEDGNIKSIGGLYKTHMDFYRDGDILMKPAGAKYPSVMSRKTESQPCPLCGRFNPDTSDRCHTCGLGIINE